MANGHGGLRPGAGRKSKVEEQALIEKLGPMEALAFNALKKGLKEGHRWAVRLFFEYMYGRPTKGQETPYLQQEMPIFFLDEEDAKSWREKNFV